MMILALALGAAEPTPLTQAHQRDIGCVAVIGIIAHEQRAGKIATDKFPDVRETGKRWAGIVGDRITFETAQPREVIAFAISVAVEAEQASAATAADPAAFVRDRFAKCTTLMEAQLGAEDPLDAPLPKPVKAQ